MARGEPLPDDDEVTRWIKPKLVGRDDDDNVILDEHGRPAHIFPAAFELRDDEEALSITWLQHFGEGRANHLPLAADAVRGTTKSKTLQSKSVFAVGKVSDIKRAGLAHGSKLRIVEDPIDGNDGHSEIRRYPREPGPLHDELATEVFAERYLYDEVRQPNWSPRADADGL